MQVVEHPASPNMDIRIFSATDLGCVYHAHLSYSGAAPAQASLLIEGHSAPIRAVVFPADFGSGLSDASSVFASCSDDGTVRVWSVNEARVLAKAVCRPQKTGCPTSLAFSGEVLFTGWQDGQVRAHDAETGNQLWEMANCHKGGVSSLALSNNLKFLVTGGEGGEVRVWEIRTRELFLHLKQHTGAVTSLQLFADDSHVLSASRDRSISLWDLHARARTQALHQRCTRRPAGVSGVREADAFGNRS